jgi:hypothetical protein
MWDLNLLHRRRRSSVIERRLAQAEAALEKSLADNASAVELAEELEEIVRRNAFAPRIAAAFRLHPGAQT